jgi:hypothetical protein
LLLEPQRTNLVTYSEQFDDAAWTKLSTTITANDAISPDGTQNADLYLATGVDARIQSSLTSVSGVVYTISVFVKNIDAGVFRIDMANVAEGPVFNFSTKTFTSVANWTAGYEEYSNGWLRLYASREATTTLAVPQFSLDSSTSGSVYIYGAQYEEGSYPTSYIPTLGSSVTRLADAASKTSANTFFGTNTGTIVINFDSVGFDPTQGNYVFDLAAGVDAANRILVYFSPSDSTLRLFYATTAGVTAQQVFSVTMSAIKKIAVKWTDSDIKMFYNGTPTASFAFGTTAPNDLTLFARYTDAEHLAARTSQVLTFPTALTDAQCIELTSL